MSTASGGAGRKKVEVTLVLHLETDVPDDWEDCQAESFVEEKHCLNNYVTELASRLDDPDGKCLLDVCGFGEAFAGHMPFDAIRSLKA